MLERYFVKPSTVDRIRTSWLAPQIERYVEWMDSQGGLFPHAFRHSSAVHLLEAGVEVNVIRAWLGHVSLDTTNRYAEITLRTKQAAVAACLPPVDLSAECRPVAGWRKDADLIRWLDSL